MIWLLVALAFGAAAALIQGPLNRLSAECGLVSPGNVVMENHPGFVLLQMLPGGLRSPLVSYLWIRQDELKEAGQYQEAMQLSEMICYLMPRCPGVWDMQSWNMAWNISVTAQTPAERWLWVSNGIRLLRDSGIPLNPRSLSLYKQLGWIYYAKMSGNTDDMHMAYKSYWAGEMQRLLGAPPVGETDEVIKAFEPIAQAPLDKAPNRQGREMIQADRLAWLIVPNLGAKDAGGKPWYDADAAQYAARLGQEGIGIDRGLLEVYNRFTRDDAVMVTRRAPPVSRNDREAKLSDLINDPKSASARGKLLAFVRAQILWNEYKLDPDWMLQLMRQYGPIDWRCTAAHGLYWVSLGLHLCQDVDPTDVDTLNADRTVQNCMKDLNVHGRIRYLENPSNPDMPAIQMWADWRFISTTLKDYRRFEELVAKSEGRQFDQTTFRSGHMNYMIQVIQMLYAMDRQTKAQEILDEMKRDYHPGGEEWNQDLEQFVRIRLNQEGNQQNTPPTPELASQQVTAALVTHFVRWTAGDKKGSQAFLRYAQRVWDAYQGEAVKRLREQGVMVGDPFADRKATILAELLVNPAIYGHKIDLVTRSLLYNHQDEETQKIIYDFISPFLRDQCRIEGLDFNKAFREPDNMQEFRENSRRKPGPTGQQP